MGVTKISEKELRKDLEAGLTKKEIVEKRSVTIQTVNRKMKSLGPREKGTRTKGEWAEDCFARDRFNGICSCLDVEKCPGKSCPFYKEADQALKEAKRENDPCGVYRKNTLEAIAMIERNQGIGI